MNGAIARCVWCGAAAIRGVVGEVRDWLVTVTTDPDCDHELLELNDGEDA